MKTQIEQEITELEDAIHNLTDKWRHELDEPEITHPYMKEWRFPLPPNPYREIRVYVTGHNIRQLRQTAPTG